MTMSNIRALCLAVAAAAAVAGGIGIFYRAGPGTYDYVSVRGHVVQLYGRGLYRHMSAQVAPQGIAQDVVTVFIGVPLLLFAMHWASKQSLRGTLLLAGTLGYFFVTYLFYLMMAMYNALFLVYVLLVSISFFALAAILLRLDVAALPAAFRADSSVRVPAFFLIANAALIGLLWLSVVIPPIAAGSIVPIEVEHYTTLVVQGLDLALFLPLSAVSGFLLLQRRALGLLLAPIYLVFLTLLMLALCAKIIAMGLLGYTVVPAIFIIPTIAVVAAACTAKMLRAVAVHG